MQATKSRNGTSSPNQNKNTKNRGSKTTQRASPRSPLPEKKSTSKVPELESEVAKFQEELKMAKDQLISLESQKKRAQQEAEESKKQITSLSAKLEDSQQQLIEISDSEDARLQELRKLSQERDKSWQSEIEALQKQHAADSANLSSAMNEVQRLKKQLEITAESEATQSRHAESAHVEIQSLRIELSETLELVEKMKHQMHTLENLVSQLQGDLDRSNAKNSKDSSDEEARNDEERDKLEIEIDCLKLEARQLKSALEASEARYQNEYIQSTLQIRNAYEAVERVKVETSLKEAALIEELKKAKEAIEQLKSDLNNNLTSEEESVLKKLEEGLADLKSALLDKETQFQTLAEENEILRTELDRSKAIDEEGENEVMMKIGSSSDEVNERSQKTTKFSELLDVTQMEKSELEAELRRVKVQADQWRKAAEAAAAILSPDCHDKVVERTVCVDTIGMKMDSPFSDNMDDDFLKKRNANMLRKIGGLWKKGQK